MYFLKGEDLTIPKVYSLHSWTRTACLMHGHRILRLAQDFEMLCLMPDFETLRLAGAWRASDAMF